MKSIKKILSGILAVSMCMSAVSASASTTTLDNYKKGDVDGNGYVDSIDAVYLRNFLSGIKGTANNKMSNRLDVNLDGVISEEDLEKLLGLIVHNEELETTDYQVLLSSDILNSTSSSYKIYNAQTGSFNSTYTLNAVNSIPENNTVSTASIIGTDDRYVDYNNPGIVKLESSLGTGTGFVVGSHTILTSAKCVFNTDSNTPAQNLKYTVYAFNGSVIHSKKSALEYHVPVSYINLNVHNQSDDYALIKVSEDLSNYINGNLGIPRRALNDTSSSIYVTGFSGHGDNNSLFYDEMVTGEGALTGNKVYAFDLFYDTDTTLAESGAPVYIISEESGRKIIIGINSYYNINVKNAGKRIDTNILQFVYNNPNI